MSTVKIPSWAAAQHGAEVCQGTYSHEDDGGQESRLDEHVVDEVHQSHFMGYVVQGHFPDVLHNSMHVYHTVFIGLYYSHVSTGEVGQQYAESYGYEQQRFILLLDTQV